VIEKPIVAVLKTRPETVIDDYKRLMQMAGLEKALDRSSPVILKNNISWHLFYPAANTTPWQLEAVIQYLFDLGFHDVSVVQNETVVTNAFIGEKLNRYTGLYQKYGVKVLYNFRESDMRWETYTPKADMLALNRIFPSGIKVPGYFFGKNIVHLPTMKCHIYTEMTGAMKNAFGGLLDRRRHYCHSRIHEVLTDLLAIQKEIHTGIFAVVDGTTAGDGPGPRTMRPVVKNYILAGADQVAVDAVSARMLGFDPLEQIKCIRLAHEEGLGCGDFAAIDVRGEQIDNVNFGFKSGDNMASRAGDLFWFGPLAYLQRLVFHTPIVYAFIMASALYHDRFWYPIIGKRTVKAWLTGTEWGKLFQTY